MSTRKSSASPKQAPNPQIPNLMATRIKPHAHLQAEAATPAPQEPQLTQHEAIRTQGSTSTLLSSWMLVPREPSGPAVPRPGEGGGGLPTFWSRRPRYEAGCAPSMAHAGAGSHQGQRTRGESRQRHPGWEEQELGNVLQLHSGSCSPPRLLLLPHHHEEGRFAPASRRSQRAESKQR